MENIRLRWLGKHVVATVCSAGLMTLIPTTLYAGLILWSGDLGGPLNLIVIPAGSAAIGFVTTLIIFLPISLLVEKTNFERWWRVVGLVLSALAFILILAWVTFGTAGLKTRAYLFLGLAAIYVVSGFFVYLCGLAIGTRL